MRRILLAMLPFLIAGVSGPSIAGSFDIVIAGSNPQLDVKSLKESKFDRIVKQKFDFSCGSAALATLLSYHYEITKSEDEVFLSMWEVGEQENIRKRGFSLLDMQSYLKKNSIRSDGFKLSLERVKEIGVPGIALVDVKGYKHFVVVKGAIDGKVLIGDPSSGMTIKSEKEFNEIWDGTIFFIRSFVELGKENFNNELDWRALPGPNYAASRYQRSLQEQTLNQARVLDSGFAIRTSGF